MQAPTPFLEAQAVYEREACARSFYEDLYLHLIWGYVASSPTFFAMIRPVWREWPIEWKRDPERVAHDGDSWWVWLVAGDMAEAIQHLPDVRQWIEYERLNVPRAFPLARFLACNRRLSSPRL